jgi:hypothetical protein
MVSRYIIHTPVHEGDSIRPLADLPLFKTNDPPTVVRFAAWGFDVFDQMEGRWLAESRQPAHVLYIPDGCFSRADLRRVNPPR